MDINQRILPTPEMIRSARGYLNWSQHELGQRCNLSKVSLVGIESGRQHPNHETLKRIASVFWDEGLLFLPEGGFRVENSLIKVLEGKNGLKTFFNNVYAVAEEKGGDFLVSGADEGRFIREVNDIEAGFLENYKNKMQKLFDDNKITYKTIISESEHKKGGIVGVKYAQYRYLDDNKFGNVPFYVFGESLGIFLWKENTLKIITIKDRELTDAYRKTFDILWKQAQDI